MLLVCHWIAPLGTTSPNASKFERHACLSQALFLTVPGLEKRIGPTMVFKEQEADLRPGLDGLPGSTSAKLTAAKWPSRDRSLTDGTAHHVVFRSTSNFRKGFVERFWSLK